MTPKISPKMREVLVYLDFAEHASYRAIRGATGANTSTLDALLKRGMITFRPGSWQGYSYTLTPLGRGHARDAA